MANNVHELRPRTGDAEKITINLGYVDLGHIDLLVQEGFYSNRTDFIRTAIRNQIERHAEVPGSPSPEKALNWVCATTAATIWRLRKPLVNSWTSASWGWPASPRMSRPNWPAPRSPQSRCSEPCTPVQP